jgi:hypothetical protein
VGRTAGLEAVDASPAADSERVSRAPTPSAHIPLSSTMSAKSSSPFSAIGVVGVWAPASRLRGSSTPVPAVLTRSP